MDLEDPDRIFAQYNGLQNSLRTVPILNGGPGAPTVAGTPMPPLLPDVRQAVSTVLEYLREWEYEDRGYDFSECLSCGWNTKDDRTPEVPMGHRPNCELDRALTILASYGFERR